MMELSALEVREGDSFLLEYEDTIAGKTKRILVDGGTDVDCVIETGSTGIDDKFIDLIICTHYDTDHITGILNLLQKGYQFSELWLPDKMRSVSKQVKDNEIFTTLFDIFEATLDYIAFLNREWEREKEILYCVWEKKNYISIR